MLSYVLWTSLWYFPSAQLNPAARSRGGGLRSSCLMNRSTGVSPSRTWLDSEAANPTHTAWWRPTIHQLEHQPGQGKSDPWLHNSKPYEPLRTVSDRITSDRMNLHWYSVHYQSTNSDSNCSFDDGFSSWSLTLPKLSFRRRIRWVTYSPDGDPTAIRERRTPKTKKTRKPPENQQPWTQGRPLNVHLLRYPGETQGKLKVLQRSLSLAMRP